jgi:hypothetical protein
MHSIVILCGKLSGKTVALWKYFVDRPESYDSNKTKSCVFIAHENVWVGLHLFPYFLTQSAQKNGIKKILQTFIDRPHLFTNLRNISSRPNQLWKFKCWNVCLSREITLISTLWISKLIRTIQNISVVSKEIS